MKFMKREQELISKYVRYKYLRKELRTVSPLITNSRIIKEINYI